MKKESTNQNITMTLLMQIFKTKTFQAHNKESFTYPKSEIVSCKALYHPRII